MGDGRRPALPYGAVEPDLTATVEPPQRGDGWLKHWQPGRFAFDGRIKMPEGGVIGFTTHLDESPGQALLEEIMRAIGKEETGSGTTK